MWEWRLGLGLDENQGRERVANLFIERGTRVKVSGIFGPSDLNRTAPDARRGMVGGLVGCEEK